MAVDWEARRLMVQQADKAKGSQRAILTMHLRHGQRPGSRCGDCAHLINTGRMTRRPYFKCEKYGITNGAATDWRVSYVACGLFEAAA